MATGKIKRQYTIPNASGINYYPYSVHNKSDVTTLNIFSKIVPSYDIEGEKLANFFEANNFAKMQQTTGLYNATYSNYVFSYIITNYNNVVMNAFVISAGGQGVWMFTKWSTTLVVAKIV